MIQRGPAAKSPRFEDLVSGMLHLCAFQPGTNLENKSHLTWIIPMSIIPRKHIENGNVKAIYWKNNVND